MYEDFLLFLQRSRQKIFIEAEARREKMQSFISDYNSSYVPAVTSDVDGICILGDVDKWGVELRIYFNDATGIPDCWVDRMYKNRKYRSEEFNYRLDNNKLVKYLFNNGYRIGSN